ncbi:MAG: uracil phosphoribosyltransferase [Micavibrio aeruginosavorus]|uniref:Uracil phosphoribosyltransferase n=1 Tax=Micavibrio aeruginosavorus TaxID=349221 RepID=A0A2W5N1M8_9BACT|nr:MAG: uracil phosphoribosyltransferase [Micavibrio aeruginosavorus]
MLKHPSFKNLHVVDHPLVQHKLTRMRDETCETGEFRRLLREISYLLGYEVTRNLPVSKMTIRTPMEKMDAPVLDGPLPVVVPVLRAGLGMAEGLTQLIPDCRIGHVGLYRDEKTHRPVEYLVRLPKPLQGEYYIVTDPMLATGHSSVHTLDVLGRHGIQAERILLMCLVAAPEGVTAMAEYYPQVPVFTAALDRELNENAYIMPGLGDAGDRLFGTY